MYVILSVLFGAILCILIVLSCEKMNHVDRDLTSIIGAFLLAVLFIVTYINVYDYTHFNNTYNDIKFTHMEKIIKDSSVVTTLYNKNFNYDVPKDDTTIYEVGKTYKFRLVETSK